MCVTIKQLCDSVFVLFRLFEGLAALLSRP